MVAVSRPQADSWNSRQSGVTGEGSAAVGSAPRSATTGIASVLPSPASVTDRSAGGSPDSSVCSSSASGSKSRCSTSQIRSSIFFASRIPHPEGSFALRLCGFGLVLAGSLKSASGAGYAMTGSGMTTTTDAGGAITSIGFGSTAGAGAGFRTDCFFAWSFARFANRRWMVASF